MKLNLKKIKEQWSITKIREFIHTSYEKLSQENLESLYKIISKQKESNEKFLVALVNSDIFRLAYKEICREERTIQDLPLGEFINDDSLIVKYGMRMIDNMVTIRDFLGRRDNSSKIAKIKWEKFRESQKNLTQQKKVCYT